MLNKILSLLSSGLLKILGNLCDAVSSVFGYLSMVKKDQIKKDEEKKRKEDNEKIDDVCKNGSLSDLLDLGVK